MNLRNFYLTALMAASFLLISSCTRKERATTVPIIYLAKPVRQNITKLSTITGSFDFRSEDMAYYGNFIAMRDGNLIKIKVYGPFGVKSRSIVLDPESVKSPIFRYILGFTDTLTGKVLKNGNEYEFDGFHVVLNDSGDILLVKGRDIKIFLNGYKKIEGVKVPHKVRVWYKDTSLRIGLKEVKTVK